MQAVVNDLLVNYQRTGKGKAIVCLHGWGDSAQTFASLTGELESLYTVLALDLPGFGGSQPPPTAWSLDDYAQFVAAWLKKLDTEKVYAVIGHSNGGAIAITGLANGNLKADKLILLASSGIRDQQAVRKNLLKIATKSGKILTLPLPTASKRKLKKQFYGAVGSEITLLPHLEATFRNIVSQDVQKAATKLRLPTLAIYGSNDEETPPSYGRLLKGAIKGSRLVILSNGGHFVHQEQPEKVLQLIEDFLADKDE